MQPSAFRFAARPALVVGAAFLIVLGISVGSSGRRVDFGAVAYNVPDGDSRRGGHPPAIAPASTAGNGLPEPGGGRQIPSLADSAGGPGNIDSLQTVLEMGRAEDNFARLFDRWSLKREDRRKVTRCLAARQLITGQIIESSRKRETSGPPSALERASVTQVISEARAQYETELRGMLGDDKFRAFQLYEKQEPERNAVMYLRSRLLDSAFPLQSNQIDSLVELLYSVNGRDKIALFDGGKRTAVFQPDMISRSSILSAEQMATLVDIANEQRAKIEILKRPPVRNAPTPQAVGSPALVDAH